MTCTLAYRVSVVVVGRIVRPLGAPPLCSKPNVGVCSRLVQALLLPPPPLLPTFTTTSHLRRLHLSTWPPLEVCISRSLPSPVQPSSSSKVAGRYIQLHPRQTPSVNLLLVKAFQDWPGLYPSVSLTILKSVLSHVHSANHASKKSSIYKITSVSTQVKNTCALFAVKASVGDTFSNTTFTANTSTRVPVTRTPPFLVSLPRAFLPLPPLPTHLCLLHLSR